MKASSSRTLDMTTGSPLRLLLAFALPIFLGNLLQQFYNLADTALAGHILGDAALAQIGATAALYSLLTSLAIGITNGFALLISHAFGCQDETRLRQASCQMVLWTVILAALLTVGFLLAVRPLLVLLKTPADTMEGALSYIIVILAGIPLILAYNLESSMLRAVGNSLAPLIFLAISCGFNVVLDVLFMGVFHFGVIGAAAATVTAQAFRVLAGFLYILKNYPVLRFSKKDLHVPAAFIGEMLAAGFSMALMNIIFSIGSVVLQSSINALGSVYIAAQVGGRRLVEVFMMPGSALGISMATYSSQNYGAGKRRRIWNGVKAAFFLYVSWWVIAMIFVLFFASDAVRLVTGSTNETVISSALLYIRCSITLFPPMGFLVIMRNTLQGTQHQIAPVLCSSLELIGKVLFSIYLVPVYGYPAVCACEPATWLVCFVFICIAAFLFQDEFSDSAKVSSAS